MAPKMPTSSQSITAGPHSAVHKPTGYVIASGLSREAAREVMVAARAISEAQPELIYKAAEGDGAAKAEIGNMVKATLHALERAAQSEPEPVASEPSEDQIRIVADEVRAFFQARLVKRRGEEEIFTRADLARELRKDEGILAVALRALDAIKVLRVHRGSSPDALPGWSIADGPAAMEDLRRVGMALTKIVERSGAISASEAASRLGTGQVSPLVARLILDQAASEGVVDFEPASKLGMEPLFLAKGATATVTPEPSAKHPLVKGMHVAVYLGKAHDVRYPNKPDMSESDRLKNEFKLAGMRVEDNIPRGGSGYVVTPDGKAFRIESGRRTAFKCPLKEVPIPGAESLAKVDENDPLLALLRDAAAADLIDASGFSRVVREANAGDLTTAKELVTRALATIDQRLKIFGGRGEERTKAAGLAPPEDPRVAALLVLRGRLEKVTGKPVFDDTDVEAYARYARGEDPYARDRGPKPDVEPLEYDVAPKKIEPLRPAGALKRDVPDEVLAKLEDMPIANNVLGKYPKQLDPKSYQALARVVEAIGGKWNRSVQGYKFPEHVDVATLIDTVLATGEFHDLKKDYQFFATPTSLAKEMIDFADVRAGDVVLEPSAGSGSIVLPLRDRGAMVVAVELQANTREQLLAALKKQGGDPPVQVIGVDFTQTSLRDLDPSNQGFDKAVMNPPFAAGQDVLHVLHAFGMLRPGGRLVAVMSAGIAFREDRRTSSFRSEILSLGGRIDELPEGSFKSSGTNVRTVLVRVDKPGASRRTSPMLPSPLAGVAQPNALPAPREESLGEAVAFYDGSDANGRKEAAVRADGAVFKRYQDNGTGGYRWGAWKKTAQVVDAKNPPNEIGGLRLRDKDASKLRLPKDVAPIVLAPGQEEEIERVVTNVLAEHWGELGQLMTQLFAMPQGQSRDDFLGTIGKRRDAWVKEASDRLPSAHRGKVEKLLGDKMDAAWEAARTAEPQKAAKVEPKASFGLPELPAGGLALPGSRFFSDDVAKNAAKIREDLSEMFPGWKFSARSHRSTGGQGIDIEITPPPGFVVVNMARAVAGEASYSDVPEFSPEGRMALDIVEAMAKAYCIDRSRPEEDDYQRTFGLNIDYVTGVVSKQIADVRVEAEKDPAFAAKLEALKQAQISERPARDKARIEVERELDRVRRAALPAAIDRSNAVRDAEQKKNEEAAGSFKERDIVRLEGERKRYVVVGKDKWGRFEISALSGGDKGSWSTNIPASRMVLDADQTLTFSGANAAERERDYKVRASKEKELQKRASVPAAPVAPTHTYQVVWSESPILDEKSIATLNHLATIYGENALLDLIGKAAAQSGKDGFAYDKTTIRRMSDGYEARIDVSRKTGRPESLDRLVFSPANRAEEEPGAGPWAKLSAEERAALKAYAEAHGAQWKAKLTGEWMRGSAPPVLHRLRNVGYFGPKGLGEVSIPSTEDQREPGKVIQAPFAKCGGKDCKNRIGKPTHGIHGLCQACGDAEKKRGEGEATVKRAKNFEDTHEYEVTLPSGRTKRIYRDTEQFGTTIWYVVGGEDSTSKEPRGFTKDDLVESLVKRDEDETLKKQAKSVAKQPKVSPPMFSVGDLVEVPAAVADGTFWAGQVLQVNASSDPEYAHSYKCRMKGIGTSNKTWNESSLKLVSRAGQDLSSPLIDERGSGDWTVYFETGRLASDDWSSHGAKTIHRWKHTTKSDAVREANEMARELDHLVVVMHDGLEVFAAGSQAPQAQAPQAQAPQAQAPVPFDIVPGIYPTGDALATRARLPRGPVFPHKCVGDMCRDITHRQFHSLARHLEHLDYVMTISPEDEQSREVLRVLTELKARADAAKAKIRKAVKRAEQAEQARAQVLAKAEEKAARDPEMQVLAKAAQTAPSHERKAIEEAAEAIVERKIEEVARENPRLVEEATAGAVTAAAEVVAAEKEAVAIAEQVRAIEPQVRRRGTRKPLLADDETGTVSLLMDSGARQEAVVLASHANLVAHEHLTKPGKFAVSDRRLGRSLWFVFTKTQALDAIRRFSEDASMQRLYEQYVALVMADRTEEEETKALVKKIGDFFDPVAEMERGREDGLSVAKNLGRLISAGAQDDDGCLLLPLEAVKKLASISAVTAIVFREPGWDPIGMKRADVKDALVAAEAFRNPKVSVNCNPRDARLRVRWTNKYDRTGGLDLRSATVNVRNGQTSVIVYKGEGKGRSSTEISGDEVLVVDLPSLGEARKEAREDVRVQGERRDFTERSQRAFEGELSEEQRQRRKNEELPLWLRGRDPEKFMKEIEKAIAEKSAKVPGLDAHAQALRGSYGKGKVKLAEVMEAERQVAIVKSQIRDLEGQVATTRGILGRRESEEQSRARMRMGAAARFRAAQEPAKVGPAKAEPAKAEPAKAEPAKVGPAKAEPAKKPVRPPTKRLSVPKDAPEGVCMIIRVTAGDGGRILDIADFHETPEGRVEASKWIRSWIEAVSPASRNGKIEAVSLGNNCWTEGPIFSAASLNDWTVTVPAWFV